MFNLGKNVRKGERRVDNVKISILKQFNFI